MFWSTLLHHNINKFGGIIAFNAYLNLSIVVNISPWQREIEGEQSTVQFEEYVILLINLNKTEKLDTIRLFHIFS